MTMDFTNLEQNFLSHSNWVEIVHETMKDQHFGTKFYEMFFLFSPSSRSKFNSLKSQAKTFVHMLKLILDAATDKYVVVACSVFHPTFVLPSFFLCTENASSSLRTCDARTASTASPVPRLPL